MIEKEKLKDYARNLMFKMNDEEYLTLQKEFEIILKQMELIEKIDGIKNIEPLTFPFDNCEVELREDEDGESLDIDDVLKNAKNTYLDQVKVPKVV